MSQRASHGIGRRLAQYRRLSGLSARQLADAAGMGLTRGVIANLESGRKTDVTVDQLFALAGALQIPPAVLALPVDEPYRMLRITDGKSSSTMLRSWAALRWFEGKDVHFRTTPEGDTPGIEALALAVEIVDGVRKYVELANRAGSERDGEDDTKLAEMGHRLARLGVDLTRFKVDE